MSLLEDHLGLPLEPEKAFLLGTSETVVNLGEDIVGGTRGASDGLGSETWLRVFAAAQDPQEAGEDGGRSRPMGEGHSEREEGAQPRWTPLISQSLSGRHSA